MVIECTAHIPLKSATTAPSYEKLQEAVLCLPSNPLFFLRCMGFLIDEYVVADTRQMCGSD